MIKLSKSLHPLYKELSEARARCVGALNKLSALYVDVKEQFLKTSFIPDANRTLRLTYGYVKGYSPSDATWYSPHTPLTDVIEKTTGVEPFNTPSKVLDLAKAKQYGQFKNEKLNDVPVAILYYLDTTGGNSGSPLLNARGELVGVNFDRAYEATISDYAWSDSYSRSIAVDIRYVLWVTKYVGEVGYLLKEMGGSNTNSVWIVQWGADKVHMIYPKNSESVGLKVQDDGIQTVYDVNGNPYKVYQTHFKMYAGLCVRDDRCVQRIANIHTTRATGTWSDDKMIDATRQLPQTGGAVIYSNTSVLGMMDKDAKDKTNVQYGPADAWGRPTMFFRGIPVKQVDALLTTETAIT